MLLGTYIVHKFFHLYPNSSQMDTNRFFPHWVLVYRDNCSHLDHLNKHSNLKM